MLAVRGVSKRHARFRLDADGPAVEDLDSRNGVFVNGSRVPHAPLAAGDEVRLGPVGLVLEVARPGVAPVTPPVAPAERPEPPVLAAMLAAALLVAQQVVGKAVRDALFLSSFDVSWLPPMIMVASLASMTAVLGFSRALAARPPAFVIPAALAASAVLFACEWALCLLRPNAAAVVVYLHMAVFGATLLSGFWSVASERFDPRAARRLMSRIGFGASAGGALGGLFAWALAGAWTTATLLAAMAALNVAALGAVWRLSRGQAAEELAETPAEEGPPRALLGLRIVGELPYLRHLGLIVALGAVSEALLDYALKSEAARTFRSDSGLVAFFALFQAGIAVATLLTQTVLVRSSLESLGLAGTVALLPAAGALCGVSGALAPALSTALLARGAQSVLHASVFRAGYELLFTALPRHRKRPTKTIVDVGFEKLGSVAGGGLALAFVWLSAPASMSGLFAASVVCSIMALVFTRRLHGGYVSALQESLLSGALRLRPDEVADSTTRSALTRAGLRAVKGPQPAAAADATPGVATDLASNDAARARRALQASGSLDPRLASLAIPWLARDDVGTEAARALRAIAPRISGLLADALLDTNQPPALRRRSARLLAACGTGRASEALFEGLADPAFDVRQACCAALLQASETQRVSPEAACEAAARELERRDAVDPEQRMDQAFRLLELGHDRELLHIARRALHEGGALRGIALEYLANVLPERTRRGLFALAGETEASGIQRPTHELEEALRRATLSREVPSREPNRDSP